MRIGGTLNSTVSAYLSCQIIYISILTRIDDLKPNRIGLRRFNHRLGGGASDSFSVQNTEANFEYSCIQEQ